MTVFAWAVPVALVATLAVFALRDGTSDLELGHTVPAKEMALRNQCDYAEHNRCIATCQEIKEAGSDELYKCFKSCKWYIKDCD